MMMQAAAVATMGMLLGCADAAIAPPTHVIFPVRHVVAAVARSAPCALPPSPTDLLLLPASTPALPAGGLQLQDQHIPRRAPQHAPHDRL